MSKANDGQRYGAGRAPDLGSSKGNPRLDGGAEGGQAMQMDLNVRSRTGAFAGQPTPAPDRSWAVPGEVPVAGPTPAPVPGGLKPNPKSKA